MLLELVGFDELAVGVRALGHVPQDVLGCGDGQELGERCPGDRREEEVPAGLRRTKGRSARRQSHKRHEQAPTFVSADKQSKNPIGSSTCSITSIAHTTSNCRPCLTRSSAAQCRYSSECFPADGEEDEAAAAVGTEAFTRLKAGSSAAWDWAVRMLACEASIARVCAPSRARDCSQGSVDLYVSDSTELCKQDSTLPDCECGANLCEDAPTAAHIQHRLPPQPIPSLLPFPFNLLHPLQRLPDELNPRGVHSVQEDELALGVPPVSREGGEVRDLFGGDCVGGGELREG